MNDFFAGFDAMNFDSKNIVRSPIAWPGSKARSVDKIVPILPMRDIYVEPFGGGASVLLARLPSKLEIYNDKFNGLCAFYRCIRDKEKLDALIERLELTVYSREEFIWSKETWDCDWLSDVERAARFFYICQYSFAGLMRNFGRTRNPSGNLAGRLRNKLKMFPALHARLHKVMIENKDWREIFEENDSPDAVFYLDPPYVDAYSGTYKNEMSIGEHEEMIERVFNMDAFVAISGFPNPLYDEQDWDEVVTFEVYSSMKPMAYTEANNKLNREFEGGRGHVTERIWIKE